MPAAIPGIGREDPELVCDWSVVILGIEIAPPKFDKPVRFTNLNGVVSLDEMPMAPLLGELRNPPAQEEIATT